MKKQLKKLLSSLLLSALLVVPFSAQAVSFPEGRATSGDLTITAGTTRTEDSVKSAITLLTNSGTASTTVASATGFSAGDYILLYQVEGTGAGNYEVAKIGSIGAGGNFQLTENLTYTYQATKAYITKINEYHNVTINSGGSWTASAWNGTTGGILVALLNGTLTQNAFGTTTVVGLGYTGGAGGTDQGTQGSTYTGVGGGSTGNNNTGGGGGNNISSPNSCGGAGGGHSTAGSAGGAPVFCNSTTGGAIGADSIQLATTTYYGGGGGGGANVSGGAGSGSAGGGFMLLIAGNSIDVSNGLLTARGSNGGGGTGAGGGGGGGSARLMAKNSLALGTSKVFATGGDGGVGTTNGGAGGDGRIATLNTTTVTGTASPTINTQSTDIIINKDNEAQKMILGFSM